MRVLNNLILNTVPVAAAQNSDAQELVHEWFGDVTAQIVSANPANKNFASTDVNTTNDTVTIATHGFLTGTKVTLTTAGGLPAGLSIATDYYLIAVDANTVKFATSQVNALAGTAVDLTTAGSGTSTIVVTTTIAGTVKLQKNNEPIKNDFNPASYSDGAVWVDITDSSQNFTGATVLSWALANIGYVSLRAVVTTTSGTITARIRVSAKGV